MADDELTLVEGDTAKPIVATLSNADGPQDLRGATVVLKMTKRKDSTVTESADCDLADAENGVVSIPGTLREAWASGEYYAEFEVTYSDTTKDVWPSAAPALIFIRPRKT